MLGGHFIDMMIWPRLLVWHPVCHVERDTGQTLWFAFRDFSCVRRITSDRSLILLVISAWLWTSCMSTAGIVPCNQILNFIRRLIVWAWYCPYRFSLKARLPDNRNQEQRQSSTTLQIVLVDQSLFLIYPTPRRVSRYILDARVSSIFTQTTNRHIHRRTSTPK